MTFYWKKTGRKEEGSKRKREEREKATCTKLLDTNGNPVKREKQFSFGEQCFH